MINSIIKAFTKNTDKKDMRKRLGVLGGGVGIAVNVLLALSKAVVGIIFGSIATVADAVNNLTDAASSIITLVGFKLASKKPDADHPYGHGRVEYISGLIMAFIVLMLSFTLAKDSIVQIIKPEKMEFSYLSITVLGIAVFAKLWLSFFFGALQKLTGSATFMAAAADSRNDMIMTAAVIVSLVVYKVFGVNIDGYTGLVVSVVIFISGVGLIKETLDPLLGRPPEKEFVDAVYEKTMSYDGIIGVHDLVVHDYGPGRVFVSLHAEVEASADILEYRSLAKLKSTYCDGLLKVIGTDGRIHSNLNQTETRTGRISSTEPNLQNIPVRSELGREMRKFFMAKDGSVLIDADYSQIELRVLAHMSNDKNMIDAFNNGDDIHAITASQVFNMPLMMVTPLMRSRAKAVNFGIVYGIGAFSLSKDIGVSRAEADSYIKGYLAHFDGVRKYMADVVEKAKENGYVETVFARRRYLPELSSSNAMMRAFGERVALNMPIQGTAADRIKIAMIKVYDCLKEQCLKARLIMQVHDELIVEAPENEAKIVAGIVKREMENAVKMRVEIQSDVGIGKTWYESK